jgi:hypothetical protein
LTIIMIAGDNRRNNNNNNNNRSHLYYGSKIIKNSVLLELSLKKDNSKINNLGV